MKARALLATTTLIIGCGVAVSVSQPSISSQPELQALIESALQDKTITDLKETNGAMGVIEMPPL